MLVFLFGFILYSVWLWNISLSFCFVSAGEKSIWNSRSSSYHQLCGSGFRVWAHVWFSPYSFVVKHEPFNSLFQSRIIPLLLLCPNAKHLTICESGQTEWTDFLSECEWHCDISSHQVGLICAGWKQKRQSLASLTWPQCPPRCK